VTNEQETESIDDIDDIDEDIDLDEEEGVEEEQEEEEQEEEELDGEDDFGAEPSPDLPTFEELGLAPEIRQGIEEMGISLPTEVQARTIPLALAGKDTMVQSRTGTGKTLAFGAPIAQKLLGAEPRARALVLAPTRELALQVADECSRVAARSGLKIVAIYGGAAMGPQIDALRDGSHLVVGTPGRVLDHIRRRNLDTSAIDTLVLDEGDEMLSMGFLEEITSIIETLPVERHTMVFSATIPEEIKRLADRYTRDPELLILSDDFIGVREIQHVYYLVTGGDRAGDLLRVLEYEEPETAIVFCNTRDDTAYIADYLRSHGFKAEGISSDLTQRDRERVMGKMRKRELKFLVATDIAARGIDLSDLSHVINYAFPESPDVYIHRTGRTGRAGKSGVAVSLVSPREIGSFYYLKLIHKIFPEERHLPSADELAARREAARYTELLKLYDNIQPSEEMRALARRVHTTVDGERLLALALAQVLRERDEVFAVAPAPAPRPADSDRPRPERSRDEDRPRRGGGGRDRDRRGGRGDRDRPRGRDRDGDRKRRERRPRREDGDRRPRRDDGDRRPGSGERKTTRTRRRDEPTEQGTFTTPDGDVEFWETVEAPGSGGGDNVRLFINIGRHQGMRTAELCDFVESETGVVKSLLDRVQVRSSYSFFNVPSDSAESVIEKLSGKSFKDREVRVERAKEPSGG